ncbi:Aste57867_1373 [Aphanomyces stellatus]|uniref:Aste57867_1373 protein n=1 Tax=Aphanomyces stellatus TaxID=120398 RepID=A0A485K6A9_9STRA|nr:hypothetical protein As57867_001372 [Aphanomyces stellatus]VFT78591.1 Aste57867_1373 [Aphanomyces stellatus]
MIACENGQEEVVRVLVNQDDIDYNSCMKARDFAIQGGHYSLLSALLSCKSDDFHRTKNNDGNLLLECCAKYLEPKMATKLLLLDMPFTILQHGQLAPRQNHSYSWTYFMDASHPIDCFVRHSCVDLILNHRDFVSCSRELLHELAFAKDQHGREVIQITDASTRQYFYDRLYYCGRYEIFEGPPVHVSNTAVVMMAYDHGICAQVYRECLKENSLGLDIKGFVNCNRILGRVGAKIDKQKDKTSEEPMWEAEFQLWDKDKNSSLSEEEFLSYCAQHFGKKLTVAMKFMKNADEYQRETENRANLDATFVLSLLPSVDRTVFEANLEYPKLRNEISLTEYPHVLVMPAADRSLEDIFLKERPSENERRILLQQVAVGLQHLHQKKIVHGDVKKLNVVRVGNRLKLIDLDAGTKFEDPVGAKFSSGSLPPGALFYLCLWAYYQPYHFVEMFYELTSDEDTKLYCEHWDNVISTNQEALQKIKPKNGYVVKTFQNTNCRLPYKLVKAHPSLDVWAFGALMYQMYSGEELVATDFNQDVVDDKIQLAATWPQEKLTTRIRNKISNGQARDLLEKLLVVDPDDRIAMDNVLTHSYFNVESTDLLQKIDAIGVKLDYMIDLSKQHLKHLVSTKQDLMRGVFEATEVTIPTSFVILNTDLTKPLVETGEKKLDNLLKFMCKNTTQFGKTLADAVNGKSAFLSSGDDVFLYLVDEVEGTPVIPSVSDNAVYPIRIHKKSPEFLAVATPFIQASMQLLQGAKTVAKLAKCVGIPNPTGLIIDSTIKILHAAQAESSVVDFKVVHAAIQEESADPVLLQRIRGAALRELGQFFKANDPNKTYAGLRRTYTAEGHALWTSAENAEKINEGKPRPDTLAVAQEQSNKIVMFYKELLLDREEKKNVVDGSQEDTPTLNPPNNGNPEKACSCELM